MAKTKSGSRKRLDSQEKNLLEHLLSHPNLGNTEISRILRVDEGTVRHRRRQFRATGTLSPTQTPKNAEKLRPWHIEKVLELLERNDQLLIRDIREFLRTEYRLEVSASTISRRLKRAQQPRNQRPGYKGNKTQPDAPAASQPPPSLAEAPQSAS